MTPVNLEALLTQVEPLQAGETPDALGLFTALLEGASPEMPALPALQPDGEALPDGGNALPANPLPTVMDVEDFLADMAAQTAILQPEQGAPEAVQQMLQTSPMPVPAVTEAVRAVLNPALADSDDARLAIDPKLPVGDERPGQRTEVLMEKLATAALVEPREPKAAPQDTASSRADLSVMAAQARQAPVAGQTAQAPQAPVMQSHPQSPQFAGELGDTIMRLARNGIGEAELRLNPADLGPLKLSIRVRDDMASVVLNAQHPVTREALEQALPRLREMFAEQGMQLTDASVGDGSKSGSPQGGLFAAEAGDGQEFGETTPVATRTVIGLVDVYA